MKHRISVVLALGCALACAPAELNAAPLAIPFDFSHSEIGLDVTVHGAPLYMILDTGVDPSVIDTARAGALGLKVDRNASGEASGEGNAKTATVFPATIDGLVIAGRAFASVDALAADMSTLSAHYGRRLDGVLGYSFLSGKTVLIDYATRTLTILDRPGDATHIVTACRAHWTTQLASFKDDTIPAIRAFRFGASAGAISLDTGSNGGITLYQKALDVPGLRSALREKGITNSVGARGASTSKTYVLNVPVGFGPFALPAGQIVSLRNAPGTDERVANIGNKLFAGMNLKMLLDYRARMMTFYGKCG
jgi:hypothetical protein